MTARLVGYMISTALQSSRNLKTRKAQEKRARVCWRSWSHPLVVLLIAFPMLSEQSRF